jgi:hypothetical protein
MVVTCAGATAPAGRLSSLMAQPPDTYIYELVGTRGSHCGQILELLYTSVNLKQK